MSKSLGAQITELTEQVEVLNAQIVEKDTAIAAAELAVADAVQVQAESVAALDAARKASEEAATQTAESIAALQVERDEAKAALAQAVTKHTEDIEAKDTELNTAHEAMKNPAFADAGARGEDEAASASPDSDNTSDIRDEYEAITDPQEKTAFWKAHSVELKEANKAAKDAKDNS